MKRYKQAAILAVPLTLFSMFLVTDRGVDLLCRIGLEKSCYLLERLHTHQRLFPPASTGPALPWQVSRGPWGVPGHPLNMTLAGEAQDRRCFLGKSAVDCTMQATSAIRLNALEAAATYAVVACDLNDADGCLYAAAFSSQGGGEPRVPKDATAARNYSTKACTLPTSGPTPSDAFVGHEALLQAIESYRRRCTAAKPRTERE